VVATVPVTRTVEGDLGMRWSARSTVAEGVGAALVAQGLERAAELRQRDPSYVPDDEAGRLQDLDIAGVAVALALRRHAGRSQVVFGPDGRVVERTGKDLREVTLLVGSGGVLRHNGDAGVAVLSRHLGAESGWQLPEAPRAVVDADYVLAPAGLLADEHPGAAYSLLCTLLGPGATPG
jgi:uncharacterized protein (TIGR01319 family)